MKKRFYLIVFVFSLVTGFIYGDIPTQERAALIALYNSTNGDGWTNKSGWKTPPLHTDGFAMPGSEGSWYGVTLSGDNVIALKLPENQLKGFIPKQLGDLSKLEYLDLMRNNLRGGIPSRLDEIKTLKHLFLDSDQPGDIQTEDDLLISYSKAGLPDLTPYQPAGWGDKIVVTSTKGQTTDDKIYVNQLAYISYAAKNIGTADITGGFYVTIQVDGIQLPSCPAYWSSPLLADYYFRNFDHIFPTATTAGPHSIKIILDCTNMVYESNEFNNEYSRIIQVYAVLPTIITNSVSSITSTSAVCGGIISLDGGTPVTSRGVCWNTSPKPTINNFKTIDGGGTGSFTSNITGLNPSTVYYVKAYATNSVGTAYGLEWDFTTSPPSSTVPTVTTNSVYSITSNSAYCGGNVISDGGATVTSRGVCWSISANPTINNSKTYDGSGTGSFNSYISGLNPSTIYYVRAYATNSNGTSYGSNVNFTTPPKSINIPTVTTYSASSVTSNSAVSGGNVTSDGGSPVTSRGVCWSTAIDPTINNSKTTNGSGMGSFTSSITGLNPGTTYYARAYATNSNGTAYGSNMDFTTTGGTGNGLIAYYPFNGNSKDESGNGNHATAYGNATLTTDRFGTPNSAFYFDGDHDYLQTGSSSTLQISTNLTFTAWVNLSSKSSNHSISAQGTIVDTTGNWQVYIDTNGRIMIGENNNSYPVGVSTGSISWNNWHFIGVTFSSGTYKFYIDGAYDSTSISGLPSFNTTSDGIKIGEREYAPDIDDTKGKLDEVRIYNKTLSASEIQTIYLLGGGNPTVSTNSISSITSNSAVCGGNVTSDGGLTVTARGVCWSTAIDPTINNSKTTDGSGTGSFTSSITGLSSNKFYYVRAYATNSKGTSYGANMNFTTLSGGSTPIVTTNEVTSVTSNSALSGGNVTSDGGFTVTARGVCWSKAIDPTIDNSKTTNGTGTGSFTSTITGLTANTTYHVRAYATNSKGTAYGANEIFITTGGTVKSLTVGNLTFYADSISQSGKVYTLSGNVNIDHKLWFSGNVTYRAGSSDSGTLFSYGYAYVVLSDGNQPIYGLTSEEYTVNGAVGTLYPLILNIELYSLSLNNIPIQAKANPIKITDKGIEIGGQISIGDGDFKLCIVDVELFLKAGDKIYLKSAKKSIGVSSTIPSIEISSIGLKYDAYNKELTGTAKIDFPFLHIPSVEAAISFQPGCIDGFTISFGLAYGIPLGVTGLEIDGFTLEVDNICNPPKFSIFFSGDLAIQNIPSEIIVLNRMGLSYQHPYRLNLEAGTAKFLGYPIVSLSGYLDASGDLNQTGAGFNGSVNFGGLYDASIELKMLVFLKQFIGSATGTLYIPKYDCKSPECEVLRSVIEEFFPLPFPLSKQNFVINVGYQNGKWNGSLKGMVKIVSLDLAVSLDYDEGRLHFSIGSNYEDMSKLFRNGKSIDLSNSIVQSLTFPTDRENVIFGAVGDAVQPQVYLTTPNGERITSSNVGSFSGVSYIENKKNLVTLFIVDKLTAGDWTLVVSNLSTLQCTIKILSKRPLPQTSFTKVNKSGNKVDIKASVNPYETDTKINFYYSEKASGGTGSPIVEDISISNGTVSTSWNIADVPTGTYYIFAKTYDNINAPLIKYYPSPLVINNSGIQPPTHLEGTSGGDIVTLTWKPSTDSKVVGYKILYTDKLNTGGYKYQKGSIYKNQAVIENLDPQKAYRFCVVAFDKNGNLSTESNTYTTSSSGTPEISLTPRSFHFGGTPSGYKTSSQVLKVNNKGSGALDWTVSTDQNWLCCNPGSGTDSGTTLVSVDPTGLAAGTYTGNIVVTSPDAINSPQSVSVTLKIFQSGGSASPFGEFSTPSNGATVASSIPVTGWVLDDIEVTSLKIYNGDSYIGDAIFIEGARPDVEQAYAEYPMSYKAGWGYMLLSNFLPNGGNGTYTFYAKASDKEGNEVTLGSKTIYCDNAHAVKPFGAIDTPLQGGTASGKRYRNWGWVLTPQPNMIPFNGTTIDVWVDGLKLGHPTYNIYRSDVASYFPSYTNSNGSAGYFDIDTTNYSNGLHSIVWVATDSGGNADGIGSRYFMIQNTENTGSISANANIGNPFIPGYTDLIDIPISFDRPMELRKGYNENDLPMELTPDSEGVIHIQCREMERIEVQVCMAGNEVEGYVIVGNRLMKLPIGSTLDKQTGKFSWIPGPGFIGTYSMVFIETDLEGNKTRKTINVSILPKFSKE